MATKELDQKLTREIAIEKNMDPMGNRWGIGHIKGTALYHVDKLEGSAREKPDALKSLFTNPTYAQKAIEAHLRQMWDMNDKGTRA